MRLGHNISQYDDLELSRLPLRLVIASAGVEVAVRDAHTLTK